MSRITGDRTLGTRTCGYGMESECGAPAVWHGAYWDGTGLHTMSSCESHRWAMEGLTGYEVSIHPYDDACDLAGSYWFTPHDPEAHDSYCYWGAIPSVRTPEAIENWLAVEP